jgi:DNA-binding NarL/FixJ family response regulator
MGNTASPPHPPPAAQPASEHTKSIFLADDHDVVRRVIRAAIEGLTNFTVCGEASDGGEAISKARDLRPDLIVMDARMEPMNGAEAAMVIRNYLPKVPIILFTMYANALRTSLAPFGVTTIVNKSDGIGALISAVRSLLEPLDQAELWQTRG